MGKAKWAIEPRRESIAEAVGHYRKLADSNPAAFLPDLALSLNNLSNRQSEMGERASALESIAEAVGHYRELADRIRPRSCLIWRCR